MLRAHRQTPKAQACQLFANSSLMHGDAEALFDLAFQINAPPAHNPIGFGVGTRPNHFRQLLLLCRAQQTGWIRRATVEQARHALRIVTVGPIPQRLPIHAAVFCRRLAVNPIQNQGNRQHPSRRFPIPAPRRFLAKLACGLVFSRNPYCHQSLPCLDATESDHAARGNPLESNLGAVGITGTGAQIDTTTSAGRLSFGIFAALADFESDLIRERTMAGLTAARARGRKGGRKFALSKTQVRMAQVAMANRDTSVADLCKELGVKPVTLYRYVDPNGNLRDYGKRVLSP